MATAPEPTQEVHPVDATASDPNTLEIRITRLIDSWATEVTETEDRQATRLIDLDNDKLREKGEVLSDETFIPDRVIESNIRREQPMFYKFVNDPDSLFYLVNRSNPDTDTYLLSEEITRGIKYPGWLTQFFRVFDGAQTHGWDAMEVVFDLSKPLHVGFEHIGHDKLMFNINGKNIQEEDLVLRRFDISVLTLQFLARRYNFDPAKTQEIIAKFKDRVQLQNWYIRIYKVFTKDEQSNVSVGWYCYQSGGIRGWLRQMLPFDIGINTKDPATGQVVPLPVKEYPIFIHIYHEDEQPRITSKVGRCFLDDYEQEATTHIVTSYVNGVQRASGLYGSPDSNDDTETGIRQLDVEIEHGNLYNKKINFWAPPYPDVSVLSALRYLKVNKAEQAGQTDFAVMARKDSKKSAEELQQASAEAQDQKLIPLAPYAEHLALMFTFAWKIIQSQAVYGIVNLAQIEQPTNIQSPVSGEQVQTGTQKVNNIDLITQDYIIVPGGVVQLKRQQQIQNMQQDWPVIQTTSLKDVFLQDFIKLRYPKEAARYILAMQQQDQAKQLVSGLANIVQTMVAHHPDEVDGQSQAQLEQLQAQVQQFLGMPLVSQKPPQAV